MASYVEILVTMILKSHKLLLAYDSSVEQAAAMTSYGLWCPVLISKQEPLMYSYSQPRRYSD